MIGGIMIQQKIILGSREQTLLPQLTFVDQEKLAHLEQEI